MGDIDLIRLWTADVGEGADQLLTDEQLQELLDGAAGNAHRAAADALIAIATSEVLVSKKIRTQDLATDGPAVAKELRELAAYHRGLADAAEGEDVFDVVPLGGCEGHPERTDHWHPGSWY